MTQEPPNIFQNPEIVKRLVFTLGCLTVYVVGNAIPIPGLQPDYLASILSGKSETVLRSVSIFGLGITPYLGAAILLSVIGATGRVKALTAKDAQERGGIYRIVRLFTAVFAVVQTIDTVKTLPLQSGHSCLISAAAALVAGALLVVWLAEEISENGIGSGVLLLMFADIAANVPGRFSRLKYLLHNEDISVGFALGIGVLVLCAVYAAVCIESAQRKTMVQYAKRVVGRMMMGGQQTAVPVKVNPAGVHSLIAAAVVTSGLTAFLHPAVYFPVFCVLVACFSWMYRTTSVDPREISSQIHQAGGYISGIRSGGNLAGHFSRLLDRLSIGSAVPVALIAVGPAVTARLGGGGLSIGEISAYLAAAVVLDFVGQVQGRVMMQNFGGSLPGAGKRARPSKGGRRWR